MCGISGFVSSGDRGYALAPVLQKMTRCLEHRGPDDHGSWIDEEAGVALGHRRLSILDLTKDGAQPMGSACGRYVVVFNGEIYNFKALRAELAGLGQSFRSRSDTEVLLEAIVHWGLPGALQRFNGMFAFALWDRAERVLSLARDALGEKPLFYGWADDAFLFASELKSLRSHPSFAGEVDREMLARYVQFAYVPAPGSIYRGIRKLLPGTYLQLRWAEIGQRREPQPPVAYWSVAETVRRGLENPLRLGDAEAVHTLDALLRDAVQLRMEADVPLGAFLSGGIDSSLIVSLMQAQSAAPVRTFTIGFHDAAFDEGAHASEVAGHLGTDHTELYLTGEDALAVIPRLPQLYDEPFSDPSQIPTFLVSQLARRHVTVSLSGDAGDELFGGYNRHVWGERIWARIERLPMGVRSAVARALTTLSPAHWDTLLTRLAPVLPRSLHHRNPGDKLQKLAKVLGASDPEALYTRLVSHWDAPNSLVRGVAHQAAAGVGSWSPPPRGMRFSEWIMYLDTVTYLPDDILVKVDRASMGVSLEARVPFLDRRLVEFAWSLPLSQKIRDGQGKWILRELLRRYVPNELIERPKMGFAVPLDEWLRGPLRDWAEALLSEDRLRQEGYLDPHLVRRRWSEHLDGRSNRGQELWTILMFQAWHEVRASSALDPAEAPYCVRDAP
jgi:asparagine synthase (glutamine-hydrolysing)